MPSRSNSAWLSSMSNRVREEIATISGSASRSGVRLFCPDPGRAGCDDPRLQPSAIKNSAASASGSGVAGLGTMARPARQPGSPAGELLGEDPFLEVVLGIEQQCDRAIAGLADGDFDDVADFMRIGGGADRALERVEHAEAHLGIRLEYGAPPAARAEGGDRRQRDHVRAERQDRAVCGEVV